MKNRGVYLAALLLLALAAAPAVAGEAMAVRYPSGNETVEGYWSPRPAPAPSPRW